MSSNGPYKKFSVREALFFAFLFFMCVAGSVVFLWFAVGVERGNVIVKNFLMSLLDNALGIVVALILFNVFLVIYYSKRRS